MPMVFICVKMHTFLLKVEGIQEMPYQNVKERFMPVPLGTTNSILYVHLRSQFIKFIGSKL